MWATWCFPCHFEQSFLSTIWPWRIFAVFWETSCVFCIFKTFWTVRLVFLPLEFIFIQHDVFNITSSSVFMSNMRYVCRIHGSVLDLQVVCIATSIYFSETWWATATLYETACVLCSLNPFQTVKKFTAARIHFCPPWRVSAVSIGQIDLWVVFTADSIYF